ncbi:calcium-activated potassium channel subunit beta-1 isoform X2 [Rattus norvegicus]|uniref:calcium-activated potassium channel subunit beta-1 isoform X2 n=1 Tax=Rattus norvegicus TaxID=10116 RepID=UPI00191764F8|nr:calcium-activated potassium channel subunit beta-1 isoform X2 [Rattus norvegicus]
MGKKLVMAQKRGETRALCLGVAMVVCAAITYYILGTTVLPLYQKSVWTQESTCHLVETNIKDQEELEGRKVPQYPCLWVNVSAVGRWAMLYHTEDTRDQNQQEKKNYVKVEKKQAMCSRSNSFPTGNGNGETSGRQSALRGFVLFFKPLSPQLPLHRPWIPSPVENRAACEDPADCLGDSPAGRGQGVF